MGSGGIARKIDKLGRIVLPKEVRNELGIYNGSSLEIYTNEDKIILKKQERTCIFCESTQDVFHFHNKCICSSCYKDLSNKI